jgi:hypothetical protein
MGAREGAITVSYSHAARIPVPVPIRMAERYVTRTGNFGRRKSKAGWLRTRRRRTRVKRDGRP